MGLREFNLPDPGEGLTEADIVTWRVAVGDTVKVNDIVVEIETAKSLVELPIPWAGTVAALLVSEGQTVEVGSPIIAIDDPTYAGGAPAAPAATAAPAAAAPATAAPAAPASPARSAAASAAASVFDGGAPASDDSGDEAVGEGLIGGTTSTGRTAVLVGYGIKQTEAKRRPRRKDAIVRDIAAPPGEHIDTLPTSRMSLLVASHAPEIRRDNRPIAELAQPTKAGNEHAHVLAKPPVRKYAKDRGVDIAKVTPAGETVTRADIDLYLAQAAGGTGSSASGSMPGAQGGAGTAYPSRGETRIPIKGVRKMTAQAMVGSAFTAPHVTE